MFAGIVINHGVTAISTSAVSRSAAVVNANTGVGGSPQALLDGFKPALIVPLIVAAIGILAVAPIAFRRSARTAPAVETDLDLAEAA